jgi:hypothetical protein
MGAVDARTRRALPPRETIFFGFLSSSNVPLQVRLTSPLADASASAVPRFRGDNASSSKGKAP